MIEYGAREVIKAVPIGVAQVYFQENWICGLLILIGMFICSPISSSAALLGSSVATLTALGLGASTSALYAGLWAYSAVLSSIAIGGMFFVMNRPSVFFYAVLAAIITTIVHGATASFMAPFGLPALTFPFNFVSWIFCLAGPGIGNIFAVEITAVSIPEDHIKRVSWYRT